MGREKPAIAYKKAIQSILQQGGIIRTAAAINAGIHPRTLYELRDSGTLEQISRGVYRLADLPPLSEPDVVTIATRVPRAVICLISALSFHDLTTQVPHWVYIALEKGAETPRIDYPPIKVHRFSESTFSSGIIELEIDGVKVRVYNPEKTLADCFKFRNTIGMDVVLEALKFYRERGPGNWDTVLHYARVCRVEQIMRPYLEMLL
ncbi:type IV toxin-antitoxin system AbiEi family antitoxin domain-containing protein [bacterium]|nr:type IV toxin-antitoxin system AbiEi family antitoxin domain-containing protein [bacterium]